MSLLNRQLLSTVLALVAIIVCCCNCSGWAEETADTEAITKCRQLHNGTINSNSAYGNDYCKLDCYVDHDIYPTQHDLNEGLRCPSALTKSYICKEGECKFIIIGYIGKLRMKIVSASFSTPINAFATACLLNSNETIQLPMRDRSGCVTDCVTDALMNQTNPVWNLDCGSFHEETNSNDSKVILEVWDSNEHRSLGNQYQGGAIVKVPLLRKGAYSYLNIFRDLVGGTVNGTIETYFEWRSP